VADDVDAQVDALSHERCRQILRVLVRHTATDDGNGLWLLDFGAFAVGVLEEAGLVPRGPSVARDKVVEPPEPVVQVRSTSPTTPRGFIRLVPSPEKEEGP